MSQNDVLIPVYRREDEKEHLKRIATEAAKKNGLEHPNIIFHNALIELK